MSVITNERAARILSDLVAIPSVNPMGRRYSGDAPVERAVIQWIEEILGPYGVQMTRQTVSPMHESLLALIPGQTDGPVTLFESHVDTVPADDWAETAFTPRLEGDTLYGRGACDDKGALTAMLLAAMDLLGSGIRPFHPVLLMAAADEEFAQTGIKHFCQEGGPVGRAIFGEPTRLAPIVQHKGTIRWDIRVHGRSAHTACPELGINAIHGAMEVIRALQALQEDLQARHTSPLITGPTLTVTMIQGGRTRNAVPDECTLSLDFRVLPGMDLAAAREEVVRRTSDLGWSLTHELAQLATPPLNTAPEDPFAQAVLRICRQYAGPQTALQGVPYGTDAAWVADRAPALVLGPGDIASAHAVDEHVSVSEVATCARIYRDVMAARF